MEQFEHNANFTFAYVWFCLWETRGEHRRFPPAKPSHIGIQNPHTYQLLQFTTLYTTPIWCYNSHLISDNTPRTTSGQHPQTPTLLPQRTSGLLMETCHVNCHVMYLNLLTRVKLLPSLFGSYFCMCHWQIFAPKPFFSISPVVSVWLYRTWCFLGLHITAELTVHWNKCPDLYYEAWCTYSGRR